MFDWPRFFAANGVSYVTRGPNTAKGQITIHCPWCGVGDQGEHLSISLEGQGYRCFRNPRAHVGRSRSRLIQALLHCSLEEAKRLAGEDTVVIPSDDRFSDQVFANLGAEQRQGVSKPSKLKFLVEFKPLKWTTNSRLFYPFLSYLLHRDFSELQIDWLCKTYSLHYALRGRYRYRIIIPIFDASGKLVCWTARSVANSELRYDTLSTRAENGPQALISAKATLLGLPLLLGCHNPEILVVCEGPFDAMRITALGHELGVYGTCLFGLEAQEAQVNLLERLAGRFRRLVLLLDPDAEMLVLSLQAQLSPLRLEVGRLPAGVEDPGALPAALGIKMMREWLAFYGNKPYIKGSLRVSKEKFLVI